MVLENTAQTSLATVNGPLPASVQLVWRQPFRAPGGDGILGLFWLVYLLRWPVTFSVTGLLFYGLYRLLRRKKPVEEP